MAASILVEVLWLIVMANLVSLSSSFSSHSCMDLVKCFSIRVGLMLGLLMAHVGFELGRWRSCWGPLHPCPLCGDEVNTHPKHIDGLLKPFGVDDGIEALDVTPNRSFVICMVPKVEPNYVTIPNFFLRVITMAF